MKKAPKLKYVQTVITADRIKATIEKEETPHLLCEFRFWVTVQGIGAKFPAAKFSRGSEDAAIKAAEAWRRR